jgi:phosphatidylserine/phosphatidylglycerophosphate/cardiolipin synthase-like enzyme
METNMHQRHTILTAAALMGMLLTGFGYRASGQEIEFVESTPIGTILDNPDVRDAKDVWIEMIGRAQRTLDLEQFYVSNTPGSSLERVLNALRAAAGRGVRVRLLADARMYKTYPESIDSLNGSPNIEARRIDFNKVAGGIQHAKYFIVDGREVFVGSQNFDWRALEHIHELGVRVSNTDFAKAYRRVFDLDWALAGGETGGTDGGERLRSIACAVGAGDTAEVTPTFSPKGWIPDSTLWDEAQIVRLIDGAKRRLALQFLAYGTHERKGGAYTVIDGAIRRAAQRGVKVRMIVADWSKASAAEASLKELSEEPNVELMYSCIPAWYGGYVSFARVEHCKFIVADGERFWLGTSNCEKGYFYGSRNLGLICVNATLALRLEGIFGRSWGSPYTERIDTATTYVPRKHGEQAP